jgi:hypothetical protein
MAIASCLIDTNILLRISRRFDPQYKLVDSALAKLALTGTTLSTSRIRTSQNCGM